MRPLELRVEGFRSFGDEVTFDWRERRLVGVVGPIGSGKSSLLDAVAFALFGKTPAIERDTKTLIKHGSEAARVVLDFEVEGGTFRVLRALRRKGASRHVIYRLDDPDHPEELSDKEREVTARVEELLHLDFGAFCRSVLLAQNRFAQFLHASPADRDKVLKGAFGFDRVDRMQEVAKARRQTAEVALGRLETRLAGLEEDRQRLAELRRDATASAAQAARLEAVEEPMRRLDERSAAALRERESAAGRLTELAGLAAMVPPPAEAEAVARAVDEALVARRRAEERLAAARSAISEQRERRRATHDEVGSPEDLARAEQALATSRRLGELHRRRRQTLTTAREDLATRQQQSATAATALVTAEAATIQTAAQARRAAGLLRKTREERRRLEKEHGDETVLAGLERRLRDLQVRRRDADHAANAAAEATARRRRAEAELRTQREAMAMAEQAAESAAATLAAAVERRDTAEEALHRARHRDMALALGRTLAAGEPCPVCQQRVDEMPALVDAATLTVAEDELQAARRSLDAAEQASRAAAGEVAGRRQALATGELALREATAETEARRAAAAETRRLAERLASELAAALGVAAPVAVAPGRQLALLPAAEDDEVAEDLSVVLDRATARLHAAGCALQEAEGRQREADAAEAEARHRVELAMQRATAAESALEEAAQRLQAAEAEAATTEAELATARRELHEVLGEGDPEERLELARGRLDAAEEAVSSAEAAVEAAAAGLEAARDAAEAAREGREGLLRRLASLAGRLGGEDADSPLSAERDAEMGADPRRLAEHLAARLESARQATEERDRAADAELAAVARRRGEILRDLELASDDDYPALLAAARSHRERDAARVAEVAAKVERSGELSAEVETARRRLAVYQQLATDLTPSRFLKHLLDEERGALADLGSERFELLSAGRYRFTRDGDLDVVDQANAEAVRKSDTLSGGETFLASLALALALAEKVTGSGGRLDAFFLDEGFGSLDEEHLDLALEGIERLVTDSPRRLVVVVSHVAALRERVEDLIVLDKEPLTGTSVVRSGARLGG